MSTDRSSTRRQAAVGGGRTGDGSSSRLTNQTNSVNGSTAGISESDGGGVSDDREIPLPTERVEEFVEEYPDLAMLPLTETHETTLRREYVNENVEEWVSYDGTTAGVDVEYVPDTLVGAVETLLESHEKTRRTSVNLEKGRPGTPGYQTFSVDADNRFMAEYQKKYYAQLEGSLRELVGGERPSGGECEGEFENPYVVMLTRSGSAVPNGRRLRPVDHANALKESWKPVYHTLRNYMRAEGYTLGEDWMYDRRWEPHTGERGGGVNHGYAHEHVVVVVDGEVTAKMFEGVMKKHVESCDPAELVAHRNSPCDAHADPEVNDWNAAESTCDDCNTAVSVRSADELDNTAAYVADYAAIEPKDLLERSNEYLSFAATVSAANIRTVTRSDPMGWAATADACKQRYESDKSEQSHKHGETVVKSDRRGAEFECIECGSPHGVDQSPETLTQARIDRPVVSDGGADPAEELRERWESARAAATSGETPGRSEVRERVERYLTESPDATVNEVLGALLLPPPAEEVIHEVRADTNPAQVVGFEESPDWKVKSVTVAGEEYPAGAGNGVDLVDVSLPAEGLRERLDVGEGLVTCECGATVGADSVVSHLLTHGSDPDLLAGLVSEVE